MERRHFIIGLGGLTGGAAASFGTGAFTAAQVTRDVSINIVDDTNALISLFPNPDVSGVHKEDGELAINLTDPNHGINQNSIYQFGYFADDNDANQINSLSDTDFPFKEPEPSANNAGEFGSAFLIANRSDATYDFTIRYNVSETDSGDSGEFNTEFWFEAHRDGERLCLLNEPTPSMQEATMTLTSGETIGVSFLVNAPDNTLNEKLEGSLEIRANKA